MGAVLSSPEDIGQWMTRFREVSAGPAQVNLWLPDAPARRDAHAEAAMRAFLAQWGPEVPPQAGDATPADFQAQLAAAQPLHGALAELETAWWFGPQASSERAARVAVLAHLLHALRRLHDDAERDRLPLPMARLARFGLARSALRTRSEARDGAIRAQLAELAGAWGEAARLPGPLGVFRALEARQDARLVREERARIKADSELTEAKKADQLKRLDGVATILAKTAASDTTLLSLLAEDATVSDSAKELRREMIA